MSKKLTKALFPDVNKRYSTIEDAPEPKMAMMRTKSPLKKLKTEEPPTKGLGKILMPYQPATKIASEQAEKIKSEPRMETVEGNNK